MYLFSHAQQTYMLYNLLVKSYFIRNKKKKLQGSEAIRI